MNMCIFKNLFAKLAFPLVVALICPALYAEEAGLKEEEEKPEPPKKELEFDFSKFKNEYLDFSKLNDDQKKLFLEVAEAVQCDCSCEGETLYECMKTGALTARATALALYIIKGIGYKEPFKAIKEAVRLDYAPTFCGEPKSINLEGAYMKGDENAPVTMVEVSDFQCPFCAAIHSLLSSFVKKQKGRVKLYYKNFPLKNHSFSEPAARAAIAAGRQGKFWEMSDVLYGNQDFLTDEVILEIAGAVGLDIEKFKADIKDEELIEKPRKDKEEMAALGVKMTPSIFINGVPFIMMREEAFFALKVEDVISPPPTCKNKKP